jgi:hypothetical protein
MHIFHRLKDSTLQVMGIGDKKSDYWSIVGGTGQFTLAQGFIYRRHKTVDTRKIIQLDIFAIFRPTKVSRITTGRGRYRIIRKWVAWSSIIRLTSYFV